MDLLRWKAESDGVVRELKIYSRVAHKWRQVATRLGFEPGEIDSIEENHQRNYSRITAVLGRWFDNTEDLPNASDYPKSWYGLRKLLKDAEVGEVAEEISNALSSPWNSAIGNL